MNDAQQEVPKDALKIMIADLVAYDEMPVLVRQLVLQYMFQTGVSMKTAIEKIESVTAKVLNERFNNQAKVHLQGKDHE